MGLRFFDKVSGRFRVRVEVKARHREGIKAYFRRMFRLRIWGVTLGVSGGPCCCNNLSNPLTPGSRISLKVVVFL